ncbi:MAG TPA: DUF4337 domain-containing protein [Candidatus Binatia bacterium]|nr:DUF4337 domain-containing protein [Candidatus Binatia bacterium]
MAEVELPGPDEIEERRGKRFTRRVALTTAVYAVVLAIVSLGGNNAMKEMVLAQQEATNQWAYYQAKVVREHLNRAHKLQVETLLAEPSSVPPAQRAKFEALARRYADEEQRMAGDKRQIEKDARKAEHERDRNRARDPYFDYAEVLLQIAIVTASVSMISESQPVFWFSLGLAGLGAFLAFDAFTLLVPIPLLGAP